MTKGSTKRASGWLSRVRIGLAAAALLGGAATTGSGCLTRPVEPVEPGTTNVFVNLLPQFAVDKIDLLFMIDNSISMADKQQILSAAVPDLVTRLVNPVCVGIDDPTMQQDPTGADCPDGFKRQFPPVTNINIGVISSSLGGHGADTCSPDGSGFTQDQNDASRLIPTVRGLNSYNNLGFLAWDPEAVRTPPGTADATSLQTEFQNHVQAVGETGCGFEASLEAWYRFLVQPDPYATVIRTGCNGDPAGNDCAIPDGTDDVLLQQRADFLRPDSLVAIVMVSDENDCSIKDQEPNGGPTQGYLAAQAGSAGTFRLPRSGSECLTNTNDPCCTSCQIQLAECSPNGDDPECQKGGYTDQEDPLNLRCWDQKRRFGFDFLYPLDRYVNGLSQAVVPTRDGQTAPNPLYSGGRDQSLVFLAGIVGVPWQDIATPETLGDPTNLEYLKADQLTSSDSAIGGISRWDLILGDFKGENGAAPTPPADPLMIESVDPRSGTNPVTMDALAPPSAGPLANPINGHERTIAGRSDLQYACIFPLQQTRDCASASGGCDCDDPGDNPLCQDPTSGAYSTVQHFAKAFPGTRQLQVLKDFGSNAIVASICPKEVNDTGSNAFGYRPAIKAITDRLAEVLGGQCLPRILDVEGTTGDVPCAVIEALPTQGGACACEQGRGRTDVDAAVGKAVLAELEKSGQCGGQTEVNCQTDICLCEVRFVGDTDVGGTPEQLQDCLNNDPTSSGTFGYCYIDGNRGACETDADCREDPDADQLLRCNNGQCQVGNPALVAGCPPDQQRLLRFSGDNTPASGSTVFIACLGAAL